MFRIKEGYDFLTIFINDFKKNEFMKLERTRFSGFRLVPKPSYSEYVLHDFTYGIAELTPVFRRILKREYRNFTSFLNDIPGVKLRGDEPGDYDLGNERGKDLVRDIMIIDINRKLPSIMPLHCVIFKENHKTGEKFGDIIAAARRERGWTQVELGKKVELNNKTIHQIEANHGFRINNITKICNELSITIKIPDNA